MLKVRYATLEDIDELVTLGVAAHAESPRYSRFEFDDDHVRALLAALIEYEDAAVIVAEQYGAIVGVIWVYVSGLFFNPAVRVASDIVLYVRPAWRNGFVASRMIAEFERWARIREAAYIQPGISGGIIGGAEELYTAMRYKRAGVLMEKDL